MVQIALMAGVILSSILACSQGQNHDLEQREVAMLLTQLKKTPSYSCLKDRADFKFPWSRGEISQIGKTQGTCFHQLVLQQVFRLFSSEASRAAWNKPLLERLLSSLYSKLEQLEQKEEASLDCPSLGIVALKYFQKVNIYLKEKKYSPCAWEIVRREIQVAYSLFSSPQ